MRAQRMGVRRPFRPAGWLGLALALLFTLPLPAYYPFLHWRISNNVPVAIPERFDLRKLPGGAVPVVVVKKGQPQFAEGDAWESLLSEVKLAVDSWSRVPDSSLRLTLGGEWNRVVDVSSPHIQVLFEDLPPGVIGMGGPVETGSPEVDAAGAFVPVRKSVVMLSADFRDRPSYAEAFFLTLMHELGHAVGLQHTFTSSVMSTGITRSTTKASPLAKDDHAGAAFLYPGKNVHADTGVIRGRVTMGGAPLHFAPVTALLPSGEAVSSISLPDGSYEIRGLPPGQYYVFAQAAPPSTQDGLGPGQIVLPRDERGRFVAPGERFATAFFPGVSDWTSAFLVGVQAGLQTNEINFEVRPQAQSLLRGATTYSFPGEVAVNPAILSANDPNRFLVAFGPGLTENGAMSPGLAVDSIGAWIWKDDVFAYPWATEFLQVGIRLHPFSATGPKSLIWRRGEEVYVQPAAFHLVGQKPPELSSVEVGGNAEFARVRGKELGAVDRFLLAGQPAAVVPVSQPQEAAIASEVELRLPYTVDGRAVPLVALSRDGQSSLHLDGRPRFVASRLAPNGAVGISPSVLPAGSEAMVTLEAEQPVFGGSRIHVDFGDPSVVVTRMWKQSDRRVVVNVAVGAGTPTGAYRLAVWNDLAVIHPGAALQVAPPQSSPFASGWSLRDQETDGDVIYPGSTVLLNFPSYSGAGALSVQLGSEVLPTDCSAAPTCEFHVPPATPLGLTTLSVRADGMEPLPVGVEIRGQPPRILQATVSLTPSAFPGRTTAAVRLLLTAPEGVSERALPRIRAAGRAIPNLQISPHPGRANTVSIGFEVVLPKTEGQQAPLPLQAEWDGRLSPAFLAAP